MILIRVFFQKQVVAAEVMVIPLTGVEQYALRGGSFTGVDVSHDADISGTLK